MRQLDPKTLTDNVFQLFDDRWTLITAGDRERCNTMTASWGGLGVLWNRPVATIYVRPQRYTYEFNPSTWMRSRRRSTRITIITGCTWERS